MNHCQKGFLFYFIFVPHYKMREKWFSHFSLTDQKRMIDHWSGWNYWAKNILIRWNTSIHVSLHQLEPSTHLFTLYTVYRIQNTVWNYATLIQKDISKLRRSCVFGQQLHHMTVEAGCLGVSWGISCLSPIIHITGSAGGQKWTKKRSESTSLFHNMKHVQEQVCAVIRILMDTEQLLFSWEITVFQQSEQSEMALLPP